MVVCRYYQQGNCRYGDRCWNDHISYQQADTRRPKTNFQKNDNYTWVSPSYPPRNKDAYNLHSTPKSSSSFSFKLPSADSGRNRFEALTDLEEKENPSKEALGAAILKDDVEAWEKGQQWPFSSYTPFKDKPSFPGFVDVSPEELRWEAYEAQKSGAFSSYAKSVSDALIEVQKKRNALKNPSPEILETMRQIQEGKTTLANENVRKQITFNNLTDSPQSTLGSNNSLGFGRTQSGSAGAFKLGHLVAGEESSSQTKNFRFQLPSVSRSDGNSSFFMSTSQNKTESASNQTSAASSGFKFILPKENQSQTFASPVAEGNKKASLAVGDETKSCIYTPLEDLKENEKEQFLSQTFTIGKIPSRPPPAELCF